MTKINYQALREAAEKATWGDWDSYKPHRGARGYEVRLSSQAIAQHVLKNNAEFIAAFNPKVALALLDERERNQQYIKLRDQENEDIALTVGKLRVELEEAKSKLNEQREYYEGVISDGSKRIAELEKSEEQLINERDHAESALADMYFAATGDRPEWSNWFGFSDAVDAVVDRIADLEAKQLSPVVPEEKPMPNPLSMYAVDAVAAIAEVRGWNACRAAMLQGSQPVSQTYKLPPLSSNEVNDAAWKLHNMLTEHGPLNGRQFNNLKGCFYEAFKVAMRNSPVTPDGWISCSERMPEKYDFDIWVFSLSRGVLDGLQWDGSMFTDDEYQFVIHDATHWMRKAYPAAPKQEVK
ncbi:DUF551 domain-containing protein [Escherichia coli]|nr:DUF551 domain-containing protein [Escherichia coli]